MKTLIITLLAALYLNPATDIATKNVNLETSVINWTGHKVLGSHTGDLKVKSGSLEFENNELSGGYFEIDMASMTCTDLEGQGAKKLVGHLSSADFFDVAAYPTAKFTITNVVSRGTPGDYKIQGDLTIKDITKPISFNANVDENQATADIQIDRSEFNVKYGSGSFFKGLGDKTIYDEFDLKVSLNLL